MQIPHLGNSVSLLFHLIIPFFFVSQQISYNPCGTSVRDFQNSWKPEIMFFLFEKEISGLEKAIIFRLRSIRLVRLAWEVFQRPWEF